jgi:hypothetical protein
MESIMRGTYTRSLLDVDPIPVRRRTDEIARFALPGDPAPG